MEYMRTETDIEKFVIIAIRDGRLKYVGRWYNPRSDCGYTVKINEAKEYSTKEAAEKAIERLGVNGSVAKIRKHIELAEVVQC